MWSPEFSPCSATITPAGSNSRAAKASPPRAGVYLALAPWAVLIALVVFMLALLATRYVSVGSIAAAMALPAAVWILTPHNLLLGIVTTALGVLAIYKHKGNIQRLMAGTENRLGKFKQGGNEMKITVLGAGAWGTALAKVLHENGNAVTLWDINAETLGGTPARAQRTLFARREVADGLENGGGFCKRRLAAPSVW